MDTPPQQSDALPLRYASTGAQRHLVKRGLTAGSCTASGVFASSSQLVVVREAPAVASPAEGSGSGLSR